MTMTAEHPEIAEEIEAATDRSKDAMAAYFAGLSPLLDTTKLQGGRHGFDFQVEVDSTTLHVLSQRVSDLEYDVREKYYVRIRTYLIPS